ncbi:MAG: (4-O-methyl)-D-glucuronate---lignin esterase [Acidobacteriota bacterium]
MLFRFVTGQPGRGRRALLGAALVISVAGAAQQGGWRASADVVRQASAQQPGFNFEESRVGAYTLPDPLVTAGGAVRRPDQWPRRRAEILAAFRENVYGISPGPPEHLRFERIEENARAMGGAATLERIAIVSTQHGSEHRFGLTLFLPNARRGRVPVFLLINNRSPSDTDPTRTTQSGFWPAERLVERGYGIAALHNAELAPDDKDRYRDGIIQLFDGARGPRARNAWGALGAWAWGASRAMDYFESDPRVDLHRVAVVGHSRGGKAALWAGAQDERFAMVVSNESGEGGAALSRRNFGETVARITESFPHWFAESYRDFAGRERELPVDQHMLMALAAPRALYVASADADLWSDPRGEYLAQVYASPVFGLWGGPPMKAEAMPPLDRPLVAGRRGYHVRSGVHNLTPYDWDRFADFADGLGWK